MFVRIRAFCLAAICLAAFTSGCKKSSPEQPAEHRSDQPIPEPAGQAKIIARIHWLGMKQIAAESNAASFMSVWNLAESQKLEAQTLDKFALAPWGLPREGTNTAAIVATNATSRLLRPLLDDLVQQESYLEVAGSTNQAGEATLAIHLDSQRSSLWQTNLAAALESITGSRVAPSSAPASGWRLEISARATQATNNQPASSNSVVFERVQDWTLISFGPEHNGTLAELGDTVRRTGIPYAARMTNFWLETDLDLPQIKNTFSLPWAVPDDFPKITLTVIGQGNDVRTVADLKFAKALAVDLEPWNIPTNFVRAPLSSFTAIRGVRDLLSSVTIWKNLQIGNPPNQIYFWAQSTVPLLSFCMTPLQNASNRVYELTERLLQDGNSWLATNGEGRFERATNYNGSVWRTVPFMEPYLKSVQTDGGEFVLGGLGPDPRASRPAPTALFAQFLGRTNLLYYDWELTGQRVDSWLYVAQFFRFALRHPQVPPKSTSIAWLNAISAKLANCGTTVALAAPDRLSALRQSSIGLTAAELQILIDWLESPEFPVGLNTFVGRPPPRIPPWHPSDNWTPVGPAQDKGSPP